MTPPNHTLFISYRQADHPDFVARIRDWLVTRYGRDHVFMDYDSIPAFVTFEDFIKERIAQSTAVLVIIGPRWLKLMQTKETNHEEDYVRIELETALHLGKRIAPIRIKNAAMPPPAALPESIRALTKINAAVLEDGKEFYDQIERVIGALESALGAKFNEAEAASSEIESAKGDEVPTDSPTAAVVTADMLTLDKTKTWQHPQDAILIKHAQPQYRARMEDGDYEWVASPINENIPIGLGYKYRKAAYLFYGAQAHEMIGDYFSARIQYDNFLTTYETKTPSEDRKYVIERLRILKEAEQAREEAERRAKEEARKNRPKWRLF